MKSELTFEDFESELGRAYWVNRTRRPDLQFEYARKSATRVRKVPAAQIIRNAPNGFSQYRVAALLLLEVYGGIRLEHDDSYIIAFSYGVNGENGPILAERADYFADVLWRMLQLGAAGLRHGSIDPVIRDWAAKGRLDRERLLRTLREGLTAGHGNAVAKWMSELYLSLEPTIDENASGESAIRGMLRAPERATVRFAIDLALPLHGAGLLDAHAFLGAVPDLGSTTAVNARDIVRIAKESADADPTALDAARSVVASAMGHPGRDIQKLAVAWLNANGGAHVVADSSGLLSPAVASGVTPRQETPTLHSLSAPVERAEPSARRSLEPWTNEDATTRMAVLLEDGSDPLEVEAALQGLAAIADPSVLAPLEKRARLRADGGDDVPFLIARLILGAVDVDAPPAIDYFWRLNQQMPVLTDTRVEEVRLRLLRREPPRALLATPFDTAGWVSADALVERMKANDSAGLPVWSSDLTAALLRLDENDPSRSSALRVSLGFAGASEAWAAIAYAFGGPPSAVVTPAWWVAAARSRSDGYAPVLAAAGLTRPGQALPLEARMRVQTAVEPAPWRAANATQSVVRYDLLEAAAELAMERPVWNKAQRPQWEVDQPTVIPYRSFVPHNYEDRPAIARWVGLTWPRSTEFAASIGVMQLAASSVEGTEHPTLAATLEAIAESPGAFGELGRSCVAFGLSAKHGTHRAQTAELLAADLGGRLAVSELAATMVRGLEACKLNRWAVSLADAAAISAHSRTQVIALLAALLPQLDTGRSGIAALLEVLDDELRRAGAAPSDAALLAWLAGFSGSSKAAKAAKSILGLAP